MDLDEALSKWKDGRLRYPQLRRQAEDDFFGELVARIKALEAAQADAPDRMAKARAVLAARRAEANGAPVSG